MRAVFTRLLAGHTDRIAGTVYGSIVVLSLLTATYVAGETDLWELASVTASTCLVLWGAHVYSHALGESVRAVRPLRRREVTAIAKRESSIILAAVLPLAAILAGAVGILGRGSAFWLATGLGVLTLTFQALRYARVERLGSGATVLAIALNLAFGLVFVLLKTTLSH